MFNFKVLIIIAIMIILQVCIISYFAHKNEPKPAKLPDHSMEIKRFVNDIIYIKVTDVKDVDYIAYIVDKNIYDKTRICILTEVARLNKNSTDIEKMKVVEKLKSAEKEIKPKEETTSKKDVKTKEVKK